MLLLGDMVGAEEAKELGLVNRVVPPDETLNAAVELGRKIAEKPQARRSKSARTPFTASSSSPSTRPTPTPLR